MRTLRKIAFLLDEFTTPSPAQQLLDRFLIGYPRDGVFHKIEGAQVSAYLAVSVEANFGERPKAPPASSTVRSPIASPAPATSRRQRPRATSPSWPARR